MPLVLHTRVVSGTGGGPEKTILNSPRFMRDAGYPMLCAYMRHPRDPGFPELERSAKKLQAPLLGVDDFGPLDFALPGRLRRICDQFQPAIWHAHDYKSNLLGLMMRRHRSMKLITTVHGWVRHTWKTPFYYRIDKLCLPHYDAVVCVSRDLREECLKIGVDSSRAWYVPNAIDTDDYQRMESVESAKHRFGVPSQRLIIGAVGRLSREKGYDLLIRAMRKIHDEKLDVELWIVGEGDERERLMRLSVETGLSERIKILGYRKDVLALYHAMDVFVSSSIREGLPNVLLEAMAMKVPVLCTRVAGIPDLIQNGENGLIVDAGSVDALFSGMRRLLGDAALRQHLAESGRETVERSYSFYQRMERIRTIYNQALHGLSDAA